MEEKELRKGPWSVEEDLLLMNYVSIHGEGHWNSLARSAGLRRTGKSCRLRWLNYLRPDVRRGNITPEEQLLILELHCRWGNRWSKIAQYLPGRTDNEIKNYWRTRVQKHAKQLRCDVNSQRFKDVVRHLWMPRLAERIRASSSAAAANQDFTSQQPPPPPPSATENSNTAGQSSREEFSESSDCCFAADTVRSSSDDGAGGRFQEAAELSGGGGAWWPEAGLQPSPGFGGELGLQVWEESSWSMEDIWLQVEL